jgi:glutamate/tyrosine decarboxylase-like PLP-dependent enzyme
MQDSRAPNSELTLDPQDWGAMRQLAHRMVDDMLDYLESAGERRVWQPLPVDATETFQQPIPIEPQGAEQAYDEEAHRRTFSLTPDYLSHTERGIAGGAPWFSDYGLQLTRSFRALKAWLSIKEHGSLKYGRLIDQNIDQAHYLAGLVEAAPQLELLAPVTINIVCFRYHPGGLEPEALNRLNQELLIRLHEGGLVAPSYTTLQGRYCLRAAIANHRTRRSDLDLLVEEVRRQGEALVRETEAA